jgi:hypothetical protein
MQAGAPFRAIGHIIDDAVVGDVGRRSVAVVVKAELGFSKGLFRHFHKLAFLSREHKVFTMAPKNSFYLFFVFFTILPQRALR